MQLPCVHELIGYCSSRGNLRASAWTCWLCTMVYVQDGCPFLKRQSLLQGRSAAALQCHNRQPGPFLEGPGWVCGQRSMELSCSEPEPRRQQPASPAVSTIDCCGRPHALLCRDSTMEHPAWQCCCECGVMQPHIFVYVSSGKKCGVSPDDLHHDVAAGFTWMQPFLFVAQLGRWTRKTVICASSGRTISAGIAP